MQDELITYTIFISSNSIRYLLYGVIAGEGDPRSSCIEIR